MSGRRVRAVLGLVLGALLAAPAGAQDKKPNIVIVWGDDVGISNISAYSLGLT
jgi:ABC-type sugar transport system substrate-binding protein